MSTQGSVLVAVEEGGTGSINHCNAEAPPHAAIVFISDRQGLAIDARYSTKASKTVHLGSMCMLCAPEGILV